MAASGISSGGALPELTKRTPILGLKLYVLILIFVVTVLAIALIIFLCIRRNRSSKKRKMRVKHSSGTIPLVSKEIVEVLKIEHVDDDDPKKQEELDIEESVSVESPSPNIGWGRWYSMKELEIATDGFAEGNVIGEGGYGIVYRGILQDGSVVAVKNLLNNKGQAEKEFKVEVEAIGKVRHKNLVGLVGYCAEGARSTGMLNEGSDVYSFGILLMELITGRSPIDYSRPPGEMNLVDWFKGMVASRRGDELVDPLIEIQPSPRSLKRALLVCLRCIDLDASKRPKMGQIVHMLEADDFPFRSELRTREKDPVPSQAAVSSKVTYPTRHVEPVYKSSWR
ncbi:Serine-threonine/tyrosine-protein kinase, catalytic domain [Sesbania bispinosa]|nr:Serine-threonine/tyrosine-protein kinase, catalytic domain [Sesbania bispinosa]